MTVRFFIDSNVLIYADDQDAGAKRDTARELIRNAFEQRNGVLSQQVLREFFVAGTGKLGLPASSARRRVELYSRLHVIALGVGDLLAAIDITRLHSLSLWDALIIRAGVNGGCDVLFSEDMQDGFRFEGMEIRNPFTDRP
jgi:predicted nucleic acid-binding protein